MASTTAQPPFFLRTESIGVLPRGNRVGGNAIAACELTHSHRHYRLEIVIRPQMGRMFPDFLAVYRLREGHWVELQGRHFPAFLQMQADLMAEWADQSPRCEALTEEIMDARVAVSAAIAQPLDPIQAKITTLETSLATAQARLAYVIKHGLPKPWHVDTLPMWSYSHWAGSDPLGASVEEAIDFAILYEEEARRSATGAE